ncbi:hypothetical protein [Halomonas sp. BC04]|uniref:hypothetical protein n=1 Tax=Halomonas sp. BC04 TaxID=1403540 RepID=UPI0012DEE545|nr:hypothetical protein [Halomonas sp. BC04]
MGQGASISPLDISVGEFFYHVIGYSTSERESAFSRVFFQVLNDNSLFYPYLISNKIFSPLHIEFPLSGLSIPRVVALTSIRLEQSLLGGERYVRLSYCNLDLNMKFFQGISEEYVSKLFKDLIGSEPSKIDFHNRHEGFEVFISRESLEKKYYELYFYVLISYLRNVNVPNLSRRLLVIVSSFFDWSLYAVKRSKK